MGALWARVRGLVGRERRTAGHLEQPFLLLAVEEDALLVRVPAGVAGARVPAITGSPAPRWRRPRGWVCRRSGSSRSRLLDRGAPTASPAFVADLLRTLDDGGDGE